MKTVQFLTVAMLGLLLLFACQKEDIDPRDVLEGNYAFSCVTKYLYPPDYTGLDTFQLVCSNRPEELIAVYKGKGSDLWIGSDRYEASEEEELVYVSLRTYDDPYGSFLIHYKKATFFPDLDSIYIHVDDPDRPPHGIKDVPGYCTAKRAH